MKFRSIFYATDKDIYDLLSSSRKKIPDHAIIEVLRENKIIVSKDETREYLIDYFSTLLHDYFSREYILEQTERGNRAEKITNSELEIDISRDDLRKALMAVQNKRTQSNRESHTVSSKSENSFKLSIDYQEMDLGRTRLAQHREREAEIDIEFNANSIRIRRPANTVGEDIANELIKEIEAIKNVKIKENKISLAGITDPEKRTKFFLMLIKSLPEFELDDVTALYTNKLDETIDDLDENEGEDGNKANEQLLSDVRRAMLSGSGLILSPEFKRLSESGFYISKILWISTQKATMGPKVEFEASLGNPSEGTDFRYNVRGIYKAKSDGTFTKSKLPIDETQKKDHLRMLERTAKISIESLLTAP